MRKFRILDVIRPYVPTLPEVRALPQHRAQDVLFTERLLWTAAVLLIYLVCSQVPLYGIITSDSPDPYHRMRDLLASNRGTLMDLGTYPLVLSSLIHLAGAHFVDFSLPQSTLLFRGVVKLLSIIMSLAQATTFVIAGLYGRPSDLGVGICLMLIIQLVLASFMVILLDELLSEYGIRGMATINLFTTANTCQTIMWKALAPTVVTTGSTPEFEGAVISLLHLSFTCRNTQRAIWEALRRRHLPNISDLLATVTAFAVIIYLRGVHIDIKVKNYGSRFRGRRGALPIGLLRCSGMPVLLERGFKSQVFIVWQTLASCFPANAFVRLLGVWEFHADTPGPVAVSGIAYYMSPPLTLHAAWKDPMHTLIYVVFNAASCAIAAITWTMLSPLRPMDTAQHFEQQQVRAVGHRKGSLCKVLERVIVPMAALGGVVLGLLSDVADMVGVMGSGVSILVVVTTVDEHRGIIGLDRT